MLQLFYNFLFHLLLPFLPLRLLWRSRKNAAYRKRWNERFAFYRKPHLQQSIWVHAVSLGEVVAATPLVKALAKQYPTTPIVFTTMTPTGAAEMQKAFPATLNNKQIIQKYVPYDYQWAVKKFLKHFNPQFLVILETELWPNILHYCHQQKRPIFLVNARLTEKSFASYYKVRAFTKSMLDNITKIVAQSKKDAEYFSKLGVAEDKLTIAGNIKFAITVPTDIKLQGHQLRQQLGRERPVWIAASTHQDEEKIVLAAFKKILQQLPDALLIIAPRHPERFDEVAVLCHEQNFNIVRYSQNEICAASTNIILADVMGQLLLFYAASDVAFVGGSLVPVGGHNILEAAAFALPIVVGPHTKTLADVKTIFETAGGLIIVNDDKELAEKIILLFKNPNLRQTHGSIAYNILEQNRDVLDRILQGITSIVISI